MADHITDTNQTPAASTKNAENNMFAAFAAQEVDEVELSWQALVEARAAEKQAHQAWTQARKTGDLERAAEADKTRQKAVKTVEDAKQTYKMAVEQAGDRRAAGDLKEEREHNAEQLEESAPLIGTKVGDALQQMRRRADGVEQPIPTPWPDLNDALGGGLWPGLHTLTGETGSGKTAAAMQVALSAARAGHPTLYIALELEAAQLAARLLALTINESRTDPSALRVAWSKLYIGEDKESLELVAAGWPDSGPAAELAKLPLRIEEAVPGEWTARELVGRIAAVADAHPDSSKAPMVVLDFLQLVGPDPENKRADARERIGAAAYKGRQAAREHGAVVLMLSSISRENGLKLAAMADAGRLGSGNDPFELAGLGKESGDIEFSADTVLTLAREPAPSDGNRVRMTHLAVAKCRARPPSWALLAFDGSSYRQATSLEKARVAEEAVRRQEAQQSRRGGGRSRSSINPLPVINADPPKPGEIDNPDFGDAP